MTEPNSNDAAMANALNGVIARRSAVMRKARQLSFDELAARSGVSKGMLVQIEQGRANPSIGTLCRIAAGLRVSVADLLADGDGAASAVQLVPAGGARVLWQGSKGGSATLIVGSRGPGMLELWTWTLFPGECFEARPHSSGTLELIQVQSGTLALEVNGVTHLVTAGSCVVARTDSAHAYRCGGRGRTQFTMVVSEPIPA